MIERSGWEMPEAEPLKTILNIKGEIQYRENSNSWYLISQNGKEINVENFCRELTWILHWIQKV